MRFRHHLLIATLLLAAPLAIAATERGVMVRAAQIYLSPDTNSPKIAIVDRGREVAVIEKSRDWLHVLATLSEPTETVEGRDVSGWILDKGVVRAATPNGDKILFGEAVDSEHEASRRGGRKGADKDALRLYYRAAEYFPQSPVAGEALYRAADIRWQIDRADLFGRPSGRDPRSRLYGIDEDLMKQVIKKFPHTKWADLAAYHLLDNKLCGDWQGESRCPEKEAEVYEKYADEHPQSPVAAEALYNAAYRRSALIELYKNESKSTHIGEAKAKAVALAQRVIANFSQSDWATRAQALLYKVDQGIPTYGTAVE
jgi:outer membrane protein assembly factor BamD (BamD/ComL family)